MRAIWEEGTVWVTIGSDDVSDVQWVFACGTNSLEICVHDLRDIMFLAGVVPPLFFSVVLLKGLRWGEWRYTPCLLWVAFCVSALEFRHTYLPGRALGMVVYMTPEMYTSRLAWKCIHITVTTSASHFLLAFLTQQVIIARIVTESCKTLISGTYWPKCGTLKGLDVLKSQSSSLKA